MKLSRVLLAAGGLAVAIPVAFAAEGAFEGRIKVGLEAERKKCTSCVPTEYDNEIDVTVIDVVLKPKARPDLSYGISLGYETENEGSFLGSGRFNIETDTSLGFWARRDLDNGLWGRVQASFETDEQNLDFGGRLGINRELTETLSFSSYINLERRIGVGGGATADPGTYVEASAELEWDWGSRGAWIGLEASKWLFDSSAVADEREASFEPGVWFELGETDHRGLLWLEFEQKTFSGARIEDEFTTSVGRGRSWKLRGPPGHPARDGLGAPAHVA